MGCDIEKVRRKLKKMKYGLVGETGAVQICRWTKNSLKGEGGCWKEKFYGIKSSGCVQMTPSVMWCENQCLHCWRPIEMNLGVELPKIEDPIELLDGIVAKRREMLQGIKGYAKVDKKNFDKDIAPQLFTMSLSGEATLYPRLGEMFAEIRRRGCVSFLVTNGLNPEAIRNLDKVPNELPTQLVISCNAPNEKLFLQWHRSSKREAWKTFLESLDVMRELEGKVRRVVRLTLVKAGSEGEFGSMTNMPNGESRKQKAEGRDIIDEYVDLIKRANPDFVHIKGYKAVGYAKDRMGYDNQVWHEEVMEFVRKLLEKLDGYSVKAEESRSCVVCVAKDGIGLEIERV